MDYKMKDFRDYAEGNKTVDNIEQLRKHIPMVVEGLHRAEEAIRSLKKTQTALKNLSDKCAEFALKHVTCFDTSVFVSPVGVQSGDITIGQTTYHLAAGYGSPVREDGETLTQEFLETLPTAWVKASLKLNTTGINESGASDEELQEKGLFRPAKNKWSEKKEDADLDE